MKSHSNYLIETLKRQKIKVTSCRAVIAHTIGQMNHPFTADDIIRAISKKNDAVHRATVYRDLSFFVQAEILRELSFTGIPATYYEVMTDHHHHHFVCDCCHTIADVNTSEAEICIQQTERRLNSSGIHIRTHSLKFYGTCAACSRKS